MTFLFACALCASLAVAPSPSPTPSPSPPPQIAHVYTSDRSDETLQNAARTTYVVTHADIQRYGYRSAAEALQNVPGVQILPYGAAGSNANFSIRGSDSAQVLVLVDGLPAPGSFANSVELDNLPTTGVRRIEVVEGGGSTLYGTGAIGGIINIITQESAAPSATMRYGSFGDEELAVGTPHVQISRTVARNAFALAGSATQNDADYEASSIHAGFAQRIGSFTAGLRAALTSDHLGAPGALPYQSLTSRERDLNGDAVLTLLHKSAQAETTLQFGGTQQRISFACTYDPAVDANCFQPTESLSEESRLNFSARNAVSGSGEQVLYGIDLARGTVRSDAGGDYSIDALAQAALYAQQHLTTRFGSVYYGVRGERDGGFGGEISPSAGFIARISGALALKGNVADAFRAPNATELFFPGYGYRGLHPERAQVADLTLSAPLAAGGIALGWFQNRTNDLIVPVLLDPATFTYGPRNVDHAFMQGLTLDARSRAYHGFTTRFNVTDLYRAEDLDAQTRLPNQAVISANLALDYAPSRKSAFGGFGVALHVQGARGYVDPAQPLFDQPAAYTTLDAYVRLNAGAAAVTLRGFNLGNERYAALGGFGGTVGGYPMPGRSFSLEVSGK